MANDESLIEDAAVELARRLPYLRPSQQRELSQHLQSEVQLSVLGRAIELALVAIAADNIESLERVFLLGLEVRQIFDSRTGAASMLRVHWEDVDPPVRKAFIGGFGRQPFEHVLAKLNQHSDDFIGYEIETGEEIEESSEHEMGLLHH